MGRSQAASTASGSRSGKRAAMVSPVGVATQNPELRKRFTGDPQHVVNLFTYLVEELREIMAELGFRTINEMVGQVGCLQVRDNITNW